MKRLDRFISVSILGALTFALIPLAASAMGGHYFDRGAGSLIPEEIRTELNACRELETREQKQECVQTIKDANPEIVFPATKRRRGGFKLFQRGMQNVSDTVKSKIETCHTLETFSEIQSCMNTVREENSDVIPFGKERRWNNLSDELRTAIDECHATEDMTVVHACMQTLRENNPDAFPELGHRGHHGHGMFHNTFRSLPAEGQDALNVCHTEHRGDREALKDCMIKVHEQYVDTETVS